jgi:hypothetical protein
LTIWAICFIDLRHICCKMVRAVPVSASLAAYMLQFVAATHVGQRRLAPNAGEGAPGGSERC